MTDHLKISEIFYSIQGEGRLAGLASVFVRLAGCPLRCWWCDTPYALKATDGQSLAIDDILTQVNQFACRHVVVTGGEPIVAKQFPQLMTALKAADKHLTVETSAIQIRDFPCDLVSISPKLSHSTPRGGPFLPYAAAHEKNRLNLDAIQHYIDHYDVQLKFVVDSSDDLNEIETVLSQLTNVKKEKVLLMAQAKTKTQLRQRGPLVAQLCLEKGFTYSPRLHVELWGNQRGT